MLKTIIEYVLRHDDGVVVCRQRFFDESTWSDRRLHRGKHVPSPLIQSHVDLMITILVGCLILQAQCLFDYANSCTLACMTTLPWTKALLLSVIDSQLGNRLSWPNPVSKMLRRRARQIGIWSA